MVPKKMRYSALTIDSFYMFSKLLNESALIIEVDPQVKLSGPSSATDKEVTESLPRDRVV